MIVVLVLGFGGREVVEHPFTISNARFEYDEAK